MSIKCFTVLLVILACCKNLQGQSDGVTPYHNIISPEIKTQKNIVYGTPPKTGIKTKYYQLDIYSPLTNSVIKRPLIIMMHGGGFKLGSKTSNSTPVFSKAFAQRGYICASINYRLSRKKPLSNFKDLAEGCYDAIADLQQAINFLKKNAEKYNIDTNNIILAGNSAGGMTALQAVFSNPAALANLFGNHQADSLSNKPFVGNIKAVVNCWGAIYDSAWLRNARVPVVCIHGEKDRVVPLNFKDSTVFGSAVIHRQLNLLGIPNEIKVYEGSGHELARHFNPLWTGSKAKKRCRDAAAFICSFLAEQIALPPMASVPIPE